MGSRAPGMGARADPWDPDIPNIPNIPAKASGGTRGGKSSPRNGIRQQSRAGRCQHGANPDPDRGSCRDKGKGIAAKSISASPSPWCHQETQREQSFELGAPTAFPSQIPFPGIPVSAWMEPGISWRESSTRSGGHGRTPGIGGCHPWGAEVPGDSQGG